MSADLPSAQRTPTLSHPDVPADTAESWDPAQSSDSNASRQPYALDASGSFLLSPDFPFDDSFEREWAPLLRFKTYSVEREFLRLYFSPQFQYWRVVAVAFAYALVLFAMAAVYKPDPHKPSHGQRHFFIAGGLCNLVAGVLLLVRRCIAPPTFDGEATAARQVECCNALVAFASLVHCLIVVGMHGGALCWGWADGSPNFVGCDLAVDFTVLLAHIMATMLCRLRCIVSLPFVVLQVLTLFIAFSHGHRRDNPLSWIRALAHVLIGAAFCFAAVASERAFRSRVFLGFVQQIRSSADSVADRQHMLETLAWALPTRLLAQLSSATSLCELHLSQSSHSVTISVASICHFHAWSCRVMPAQVARVVGHLWSMFDAIAADLEVTRVAQGDSYILCAGLLGESGNAADTVVHGARLQGQAEAAFAAQLPQPFCFVIAAATGAGTGHTSMDRDLHFTVRGAAWDRAQSMVRVAGSYPTTLTTIAIDSQTRSRLYNADQRQDIGFVQPPSPAHFSASDCEQLRNGCYFVNPLVPADVLFEYPLEDHPAHGLVGFDDDVQGAAHPAVEGADADALVVPPAESAANLPIELHGAAPDDDDRAPVADPRGLMSVQWHGSVTGSAANASGLVRDLLGLQEATSGTSDVRQQRPSGPGQSASIFVRRRKRRIVAPSEAAMELEMFTGEKAHGAVGVGMADANAPESALELAQLSILADDARREADTKLHYRVKPLLATFVTADLEASFNAY